MALRKTTRYSRHTFGDNGAMGNKQVVSVSFAATDLGKPADADVDALLAATAVSASAATTLTPTSQPGVPRSVTATLVAGTDTDIAAGNITITGTNSEGKTITENLAVTADTEGTIESNKAFATVTSAAVPQQDGASVTVSLGLGNKFGTGFRTASTSVTKIMTRTAAGVVALEDASASAASTSAVESNTVTPTTTPDGTVNMRAYTLNYNWHADPDNDNPTYGV